MWNVVTALIFAQIFDGNVIIAKNKILVNKWEKRRWFEIWSADYKSYPYQSATKQISSISTKSWQNWKNARISGHYIIILACKVQYLLYTVRTA